MSNPETFSSPASPEGEPLADRIERVDLLRQVAASREAIATNLAANVIAESPELTAMLDRLIEGGGELHQHVKLHLRKMIALKLGGLSEEQMRGMQDYRFFTQLFEEFQSELSEMAEFEQDVSNIPDAWDMAIEDLLSLEENDDK